VIQFYLGLFIAGIITGGFSGYKLTSISYEAQQARALQDALIRQHEQLEAAYAAEKAAIDANHKEELKNHVIVREIVKTIPKIQRVRSECNYTRGTVRLLNDAAAADVPKTASVPAEADSAGSDVTGERGIKYSLELLRAYNLARNQCNSLIGFVDR
jgi:hypothetical protein